MIDKLQPILACLLTASYINCSASGSYLKTLTLTPDELEGRRLQLTFEGVYERWTLHVNGHKVGFRNRP